MKDRYVPAVGERIKLKAFFHYSEADIPVWAWLAVREVGETAVVVEVLNGDVPTGRLVSVPIRQIDPPIGWAAVYDIVANTEEKATRVAECWFKRGIHVWASHDLSSAGQRAFTPVDTSDPKPDSPRWKYTANPVETVSAADCPHRFTVSWEESKDDYDFNLPTDKAARQKAMKALKADGWKIVRHRRHSWVAYRIHRTYTPQ